MNKVEAVVPSGGRAWAALISVTVTGTLLGFGACGGGHSSHNPGTGGAGVLAGTGGAGMLPAGTGGSGPGPGAGTGGAGGSPRPRGGTGGEIGPGGGTGGGGDPCLENQQFEVFWEEDDGSIQYACGEIPDGDYVNLHTNFGEYTTDQPICTVPFDYMGRLFTFDGITQSGLPEGTYVISADLVDAAQEVISTAAGPGPGFPITTCGGLTVAFQFLVPPP